jgi:organic hydroperoxide reductase OsmC/OhrA
MKPLYTPAVARAGDDSASRSLSTEGSGDGLGREEALMESAHKICPYSNAARGNVDVELVAEA